MERLTRLLVAGAVAVAVSAVAVGPAVAAKGGNSDNAHACQQGGHENRFEAETARSFKNAGDCASLGAQGGATGFLQLATGTYMCGGATCWGALSGSGLDPHADVLVIATGGAAAGSIVAMRQADATGNLLVTRAFLQCGVGGGPFRVQSVAPGGRIFFDVNSPCG
jgi:hypothetical protein